MLHLSTKESGRLPVMMRVLEGSLSQKAASALLGISDRQIRRIVVRVREERAGGLAHRSRGKASPRRIPEAERQRVVKLYEDK